jgi:hypothetical protein
VSLVNCASAAVCSPLPDQREGLRRFSFGSGPAAAAVSENIRWPML